MRKLTLNGSWFLGMAAALLVCGQAMAVEYANIDVADGTPSNTAPPTATIPAGQKTSDFFLDTGAVVGEIPIRIGASAADDYLGGVLIGGARETARFPADDASAPLFGFSPSVATVTDNEATSANTRNVEGGLSLISRRAGANAATAMYPVAAPLNTNLSAAYFPFSEGWQGGTATSSAPGSFLDTFNGSPGITFSPVTGQTNTSNIRPSYFAAGQNFVSIPGVTDTRQQGILLAMSATNEEDFALVSSTNDGDGWTVETKNNHIDGTGTGENNPFSFVFLPLGTPNVTMGVMWGGGDPTGQPQAILKSGANFSVVRETTQNGAFRLHIDGQSPTSGVLVVQGDASANGGGGGLPGDNLVTYRADGNDWIIVSDDLPTADSTNGQNGESGDPTPYFQFAFMPFNAKPTAPGAIPAPVWNKSSVWGYKMNMTEINGRDNNNDDFNATLDEAKNIYPGVGVYGTTAASTPGLNVVPANMNRGDPRATVNGANPTTKDGVMFATISEGLRDNSATNGIFDYGLAGCYTTANGIWTVATSGADPSTGEANLNYSVAFFGANTGFTMGFDAPHNATGLGTVTISGVNSQTDGVLMANNGDNEDNFVTVTPHADGSGWDVQNWDNGLFTQDKDFNYIYLPYTTQNLVAGRVNADGTLINSTDTSKFQLVKEADGSYLLTVNGRTPNQGMLLLSADATDPNSADNTLVYEPSGNSFRILGVDMISVDEKAPNMLTSLENTAFQFAFIDWVTPPTLNLPTFLAADFNHDGEVNSMDLGIWKSHVGTGTSNADGDANGDSKVDGADFLVWQTQLGQLPTAAAAAGAVPEPSAVVLGLLSLSLVGGFRRRQAG